MVIPTDGRIANKYMLKGNYAIMENLPRPKTYEIEGHACFRVADVSSLHMALSRSMEFTVVPAKEAIDETTRQGLEMKFTAVRQLMIFCH